MTSQLVLMNQLAVAVASDTLTSWQSQKTSPSRSKIYELPAPAIGVVTHCGDVFLQGASWRLLIRDWSRSVTPLGAPRMADYRDGFTHWVNQHAAGLALSDQVGVAIRLGPIERDGGHIGWLAAEMGSTNREELLRDPIGADEDLADVIAKITETQFPRRPYADISEEQAQKLISESGVDIEANFRSAMKTEDDAVVGPATQAALLNYCVAVLRGSPNWESATIELTFAGYGSQESLGQVSRLGIYGYWGGHLRFDTQDIGSDTPTYYSFVIPIAQRSAIDGFYTGTDGFFDRAIRGAVGNAVRKLDGVDSDKVAEVVTAVQDELNDFSFRQYRGPMDVTIGSLGISNLGKFAEFLLHLQAFRSATDDGEATVGGHIESLIITPEHGVRWRNRLSDEIHGIEDSSHAFE